MASRLMQYILKNGVWRSSIYLCDTGPRYEMIYYAAFAFWQWKPVPHNLDNILPCLNSLCSNRFILNPSGLAKMLRKNITTKFPWYKYISLQVIHRIVSTLHVKLYWFPNLFPTVLFAGHSVTHEGHNCQCWSTWRIHFLVTGMNFGYIPVNTRPIHWYL